MNSTINISLPKKMLQDAKQQMTARGFTSFSEFIRTLMREELYSQITENGFTPEFEEEVLKSAATSNKDDIVLETDDDVKKYFKNLRYRIKKRHGKG